MPAAIPCNALMDRVSNEFDDNSWGYIQQIVQKWPKIVLSAGMKTFEIWKLGNYKSDIDRTLPRHVPSLNISYTKIEGVN